MSRNDIELGLIPLISNCKMYPSSKPSIPLASPLTNRISKPQITLRSNPKVTGLSSTMLVLPQQYIINPNSLFTTNLLLTEREYSFMPKLTF